MKSNNINIKFKDEIIKNAIKLATTGFVIHETPFGKKLQAAKNGTFGTKQ